MPRARTITFARAVSAQGTTAWAPTRSLLAQHRQGKSDQPERQSESKGGASGVDDRY